MLLLLGFDLNVYVCGNVAKYLQTHMAREKLYVAERIIKNGIFVKLTRYVLGGMRNAGLSLYLSHLWIYSGGRRSVLGQLAGTGRATGKTGSVDNTGKGILT